MYRVVLHKVSIPEQNCFVNNPRSEFYVENEKEVCDLIVRLPKGWFISLLEFDFDTCDSILNEFNFDFA